MIKQVMNWIKTHRYCLAGLYMLVFLSGFFLLELHEPSDVHIIHCAVDDLIPFNEWFVLPYFLWYAWVPVFMLYFMIQGPGGISETLLYDVCRSNLLLICLPAGTKRFKSAAGDHITEFLRADCAVSAEGGSAEQCLPVDPCIEHCGGTSDDLPRGKCAEQETDPYTFVDCHDSDLSFNHVHQTAFAGRCALWLDFEPDS